MDGFFAAGLVLAPTLSAHLSLWYGASECHVFLGGRNGVRVATVSHCIHLFFNRLISLYTHENVTFDHAHCVCFQNGRRLG